MANSPTSAEVRSCAEQADRGPALSMPDGPPHTNSIPVHDHQASGEVFVMHISGQSLNRSLGHLNCRRPHSKPNYTAVRTNRKHPRIGKVFVKRDDDGGVGLRPFGGSSSRKRPTVRHPPRAERSNPAACPWDVLSKQDAQVHEVGRLSIELRSTFISSVDRTEVCRSLDPTQPSDTAPDARTPSGRRLDSSFIR